MAGALFVVATPIGNLEDLTFRALKTLREVDLIAAEDTRRTAKLLARYEVQRPLVSLREHNEARQAPVLLDRIATGESVALVTDAGTPGIADPGSRLVHAAHQRAIRVVPVPGASAVAAALSASGLPADQYVFFGYPPPAGARRRAWFSRLSAEPRTAVFFEAPHRLQRTANDLIDILVNRPIIVCRELTKINEQLVICTNTSAIMSVRSQGELTLVLAGASSLRDDLAIRLRKSAEIVRQLQAAGLEQNAALSLVAEAGGLQVSAVSKIIKKLDILAKQHNMKAP